jgi:3-oxoacyl-[acyl-carrier-protein] synthase II
MKRVVVTGLGLVTPLGCGVEHSWNNLLSGISGCNKISKFDPSEYKCKVACEVPLGLGVDGKFNPEEWIEKKEIKKIDDFIQFSMSACEQAIQDSKIEIYENLSLRSGCIIGSGIGGLPGIEKTSIDFHVNKTKISPFFIIGRLINMAAGYASLKYKLKGPNYSTVSACSSGAHAIGESVRLIQSGKMDLMVTGGAEGAISPLGIEGFTACRALSTT